MRTTQISPDLWVLSAQEPQFRGYRYVSFTEEGVSYNAYLLRTDEGFLSLGSLPKRYCTEWVRELQRVSQGNVKWAVFFGTDTDRPAAKCLLEEFPDCTILSSKNGLFQLSACLEREYRSVEIRNDRKLTLGGRPFQFRVVQEKFQTPCVYALDKGDGTLYTADLLGSVMASEQAKVSELPDVGLWLKAAGRYRDDVFAQKRGQAVRAVSDLIREEQVSVICPAFGPVVDTNIEELLAVYQPAPAKHVKLAILYQDGGSVSELAERIEQGVMEAGVTELVRIDLSAQSAEDAWRAAAAADALLLGTPEVRGDAAKSVWDLVTSLSAEQCAGKPAAIFTSCTVAGRAKENLRQRLEQLGCDLVQKDYSIQGVPDQNALDNAYEYGYGWGCYLLKQLNTHQPKWVKCLVCGEIFDAALGVCPVCGVGLDQCVPVEMEESVFQNPTENRYLILGGGVAAVSAAEAIRLRDETGTITLLSAEPCLPINRPMLTKDLVTVAKDPDSLQIHGQEWYTERKLDLRLGVTAVELDTEQRRVLADDGNRYPYDRLILATGAECFVPPIPGWEKEGVLTIRHLSDSAKLQKQIDGGAKHAVVIGGGVLGLEAASELMRAGLKIVVLESAPQIMGRQIDGDSAAALRAVMAGFGVQCHEGVTIAEIEGGDSVTAVRLEDGRSFPADVVVISCGNRGNVSLAQKAGIAVERFISVNERMETSVPGIYACGDCCQMGNVNYQLWAEAGGQGRVAGANAAGESLTYANQPLGMSFDGFGTTLFALGDPGKREGVSYRTVELSDQVKNRRESYWFFGGALQGAVAIGAPEKTAELTQAVTTHARYDELF